MWRFWRNKKKKHIDEVTAFKYNDKLYPNLHAMLSAKERQRKREAKRALRDILYYLAVDQAHYNHLDEFGKRQMEFEIERHYVFRGEVDMNKLTDLLIEHWQYIGHAMNEHQRSKKLRDENGPHSIKET